MQIVHIEMGDSMLQTADNDMPFGKCHIFNGQIIRFGDESLPVSRGRILQIDANYSVPGCLIISERIQGLTDDAPSKVCVDTFHDGAEATSGTRGVGLVSEV